MKKALAAMVFILLLFLAWFFWPAPYEQTLVCFSQETSCIRADVADSADKRVLGLSGRRGLSGDEGMLFVFEEEGVYGFWMKGMLFPIDIIWLDSSKKAIYLKADAIPCYTPTCPSYGTKNSSRYVVEVPAGYAREHNITEGTQFYF